MAAQKASPGMSEVELHHGAATDVGRVREVNEDAYLAAAVNAGGRDNATAVVVDVVGLVADRPYDPTTYDSALERRSLEAKLGAPP